MTHDIARGLQSVVKPKWTLTICSRARSEQRKRERDGVEGKEQLLIQFQLTPLGMLNIYDLARREKQLAGRR